MTDETRMIIEEINGLGQRLDKKIDGVEQRLDKKIDGVEQTLDKKIDSVQQTLDKKTNDIQLTLENETNRNIKIIAEAHTDLRRKLDETLKAKAEKELLMIRVNRLENEVRQIKEKMDDIA